MDEHHAILDITADLIDGDGWREAAVAAWIEAAGEAGFGFTVVSEPDEGAVLAVVQRDRWNEETGERIESGDRVGETYELAAEWPKGLDVGDRGKGAAQIIISAITARPAPKEEPMDETDIAEVEQQLAREGAYQYHAIIDIRPLDPAQGWVERRLTVARAPADLSLPGPVQAAHTSVAVSPQWLTTTLEPDEDEGDEDDTVEQLGLLAQQKLWDNHGYAVCGEWSPGEGTVIARVVPVEGR